MHFKEQKPIYLQIADCLCNEILANSMKEEERIPSVREYASNMEVNVNTCMRAYDYLQQQDIIFNRRGLGYFVALGARETISAMKKKEFVNESLPELVKSMKSLNISISEVVDEINKILNDHE